MADPVADPVVDPVAEIAARLRWLREHPEERRRMGRRAREAVAGRTWSDYGRNVCDVYAELVGGLRGRAA